MEYIIKNTKTFKQNDINSFYNLIPVIKKEKINNLINQESKNKSIIGEILLSKLLEKYNISYNNINYYLNTYGKPYISNHKIFFNISHSFDYVITAISTKEIGIDIEKIRKIPINVINQFATFKEKKYILSSKRNVEARLFKIYTLKEAYFKMLGTNLNHILEVEFIIKNNKVYCNDKNINTGFINEVNGYVIAYCERI